MTDPKPVGARPPHIVHDMPWMNLSLPVFEPNAFDPSGAPPRTLSRRAITLGSVPMSFDDGETLPRDTRDIDVVGELRNVIRKDSIEYDVLLSQRVSWMGLGIILERDVYFAVGPFADLTPPLGPPPFSSSAALSTAPSPDRPGHEVHAV